MGESEPHTALLNIYEGYTQPLVPPDHMQHTYPLTTHMLI